MIKNGRIDFEGLGLSWLDKAPYAHEVVSSLILVVLVLLVYGLTSRILLRLVQRLINRTEAKWDDALEDGQVFRRLAYFPPALAAFFAAAIYPGVDHIFGVILQRVAVGAMIAVGASSVGGVLTAANSIYSGDPENVARPIKGYIQIVRVFLYLGALLLVVAVLMDRSPWIFLSGLGAMTAVLLLVFRDTLLSLVASIQLTGNDMLHVGDWIEMPKFGADGDVIDIALYTVKVQNWDKTITTIPTYSLIQESFKNWRGMSQAGGRRIKRSFQVDVSTVHFLSDSELEKLSGFGLLAPYLEAKRGEITEHNAGEGNLSVADRRHLTNVGTFRAYIYAYLRNHRHIRQGMTLLVRHLQPTSDGLPVEVYCFTSTTVWAQYEDIQSDIFDHIYSIAPEFGLRVFQSPSGADVERGLAGATPPLP
ncbi:MAG: mechanosensitive ion channel family protein [Candidatus Binatia bacterium]|nr:mechanosensitive ion channel family protein [Candidatus Binatia bacterium]